MSPTADKSLQPKYVGNLLFPIIILALTAVFFSQSLDFPPQEDVGAEAVPHLWTAFITIFCIYLIIAAIRKKGIPDPIPGNIGQVILYAVGLGVYLLAASNIGYFISTFFFSIVSMYALTYRGIVIILSVAVGWTVFSYLIFYRLLYIQLPMNEWLLPFFQI